MRIFRFVTAAAVLTLVGSAEVDAQTIGFKLGSSFSNASIEPDEETKTLTAFTGGGFLRFPFGPLHLQPELMYITKGVKLEDPDEPDVEGKLKVSYVEIPVLLVLPLTQGASFQPYILGGPAFAIEAGCEFGLQGGGISADVDCDEGDEDFSRKKFDVGAMLGLGFGFPAGPGAVLVEGRYNFGLLNMADTDGNESFKHRSAAVLIGYSIPLSR